jgi:chromosome segregation ATPase
MAEHEWVDVPEMTQKYVYTLEMPLEQHNTEIFNAGREAIESKLVATQRKLMTAESQLRDLADAGIQSAQRTNAELERVTEKVAEQEQMIADLQAIIEENRGLNEQLNEERRVAVNSLSAAKASDRNGWAAFEAKKNEWHKLYEEKERTTHACNELREQLRCARRDHEATKSHHKSLIEDREHVCDELGKVRGELKVEKEAVGVLRAQLAQAEERLASLLPQPQTVANELDRLRKELQEETERKESMQLCATARNQQIDRLAAECRELRECAASVKRERELFRKEAGEMRTRMEAAEQQLRDINKAGVVEEAFRRLESEEKRELAEALNANADLKATISAMMFAHTVLSKELHAKENEVAALQETVNALDRTVIEELKAELVAQNDLLNAERAKRMDAEQDVLRLHAIMQEMSAEQDDTTKQLRALAAKEEAAQHALRKERGMPPLYNFSINDPQLLSAAQQHVAAANRELHTKHPFNGEDHSLAVNYGPCGIKARDEPEPSDARAALVVRSIEWAGMPQPSTPQSRHRFELDAADHPVVAATAEGGDVPGCSEQHGASGPSGQSMAE